MGLQTASRGILERDRGPAHRRVRHTDWAGKIPDEEWAVYQPAINLLRSTGRPFMLAGAFSLASYTGLWRNTKDLDFYVLPQDRETVVAALTQAGFTDYYDKLPYVRHWIYRAWKDDCIVDVIWAMANQRAQVDEGWFAHAPEIAVRGEHLLVVPAEELLWCKLYVLQKDRCDWTDIFNLIHSVGSDLDWEHLVRRLEGDLPLLVGLLNVYCWLCPGTPLHLPAQLQELLPGCDHEAAPSTASFDKCHIDFLDTRPWFIAAQNQ